MHVLRCVVHDAGIVRRHVNRRYSLEAVAKIPRIVSVHVGSTNVITFFGTDAFVEDEEPAFAVRVNNVVVAGLRHPRSGFASTRIDEPGSRILRAKRRLTRHGNRGRVVLLSGIQPVRILVIHFYLVNLDRRLIELRRPGLAAVVGDVCATVVTLDEEVRIFRVNPHVMVVVMRRNHAGPRFAAILGFDESSRERVNDIGILRVGLDVAVVERPVANIGIVGDLLEGSSLVNGPVQAAIRVRRFDECIDNAGVSRRYGEIDVADQALWQSLSNFFP